MGSGTCGTFVISWSQVELDGQWAAPLSFLAVGATWTWTGDCVRVDGPAGVLGSDDAAASTYGRRDAARAVRRLMGRAGVAVLLEPGPETPSSDMTVTLTDGRLAWTVTLIHAGGARGPLVMIHGAPPPRQTELWVVSHAVDAVADGLAGPQGGVICFTPGTMILTPAGPVAVESLHEGDLIQTKDDGPAEILWMARRRISGARLHVMPHLAPIRLREGALDRGVPDKGLLVSPDHRLVLRGPRARALFNSDEVLVAASDLVNDHSILVERGLREVTYIHLLLPRHGIVFANAVETESFHPASAALASLGDEDHARLGRRLAGAEGGSLGYGAYARRVLSRSEAAMLRHDRP